MRFQLFPSSDTYRLSGAVYSNRPHLVEENVSTPRTATKSVPAFAAQAGRSVRFEQRRCLPMIEQKQLPELLETSLVCALSVAVAALGFLLGWLICVLAGFGRT
jgi:hypothetical protein